MFLKRNQVKSGGKTYEYALIVRSVRKENGKVTQEVVKNLGRMRSREDWEEAKKVLEAMREGENIPESRGLKIKKQTELGLSWIVKRMWKEYGIEKSLSKSFEKRKPEFNPERITFYLTTNRLYKPSSDLAAHRWINERAWPKTNIERQWIYRTLGMLADEKEEIEERLLEKLKDYIDLRLVFYDLTSVYFEGDGPSISGRGYSRDHRSDRKQVVLGMLMADGIPISHRVWEGNKSDKTTLKQTVRKMKKKFGIDEVVFVADRGLMTAKNVKDLEETGYDYILATARRRTNVAKKLLQKKIPGSKNKRVRELKENNERYILCLNKRTRKKELKRIRKTLIKIKKKLKKIKKKFDEGRIKDEGVWKRVEKMGRMKRFFDIKVNKKLNWEIDKETVKYEKSIAGKFLLKTTTDLEPQKVMEKYMELKDVENSFDDLKNLLNVRPVYHWTEKGLKGHMMICHLALLIEKLIEKKTDKTFREVKEKLEVLRANEVNFREEKFLQRNEISRPQEEIFDSIGLGKPPKILNVVTKN